MLAGAPPGDSGVVMDAEQRSAAFETLVARYEHQRAEAVRRDRVASAARAAVAAGAFAASAFAASCSREEALNDNDAPQIVSRSDKLHSRSGMPSPSNTALVF